MVHAPLLARSMVDKSPWPAPKLTGARPSAALVTGKGLWWYGEMEGVPAMLTYDGTQRRSWWIEPMMRFCGSYQNRLMRWRLELGRGDKAMEKGCSARLRSIWHSFYRLGTGGGRPTWDFNGRWWVEPWNIQLQRRWRRVTTIDWGERRTSSNNIDFRAGEVARDTHNVGAWPASWQQRRWLCSAEGRRKKGLWASTGPKCRVGWLLCCELNRK
jgi:hypothetical protein